MSLKARITEDMKGAMRAKDAPRLSAIRLLLAAMKQKEVDERVQLDDAAVIGVIQKMIKQRRESIAQYEKAARADLAATEHAMDELSTRLEGLREGTATLAIALQQVKGHSLRGLRPDTRKAAERAGDPAALLAQIEMELVRYIGGGAYGEVWLARSATGAFALSFLAIELISSISGRDSTLKNKMPALMAWMSSPNPGTVTTTVV